MLGKLRVEYPGALYHVMNRGGRSEGERQQRPVLGQMQLNADVVETKHRPIYVTLVEFYEVG
jgi:hypothetical protein